MIKLLERVIADTDEDRIPQIIFETISTSIN